MQQISTERRRDPRSVCSVMSEVFVRSTNGYMRYLAPAILADISASGLALVMDFAPTGHQTLHIRNSYFHADVYIRITVPQDRGVRVGCELVSRLEWQPERFRTLT
jgi:hypothetical protein